MGNSQTYSGFPRRVTVEGLSTQQRSLLELMQRHQFGRIEKMTVRGGQPILDHQVRVVQVAHLGSRPVVAAIAPSADFELKSQVCDLFDRLGSVPDGTEVRLEFRHGLPFSMEIVHLVGVECAKSASV